MSTPIIQSIDPALLSFGPVKPLKNGTKIIPLLHNGSSFWLKTQKTTIPFVPSDFKGNGKYQMSMSLKDITRTQAMIEVIDQWMVDQMTIPKNCVELLGCKAEKIYSREVIESKHHPMIRYAKDKGTGEITTLFPPTVQVSLPAHDNKFFAQFFNGQRQRIEVSPSNIKQKIPKRSLLAGLVSVRGWTSSNGFGVTFSGEQFIVEPPLAEKEEKHCLIAECTDD
jgi:hypothetical protein